MLVPFCPSRKQKHIKNHIKEKNKKTKNLNCPHAASFPPYNYTSSLFEFQSTEEKKALDPTYYIKFVMEKLRALLGQPEGYIACMAMFVAGIVLTFLDPTVKLVEAPDS